MIIGLHGRIGSGKNEAAKRLAIIQQARPVIEVSFAKKLKESVAALFDISLGQIEQWKNDDRSYVDVGTAAIPFTRGVTHSFREFLQRYGTEAHRDVFGQDFWLDAALPLDKDYTGKLYVVTDMRFPNEVERVKALGGYTVLLRGPDGPEGEHSMHVSEKLSECDFFVDNAIRDDDFKSLDFRLREVLNTIFGSRYPSEWLFTD